MDDRELLRAIELISHGRIKHTCFEGMAFGAVVRAEDGLEYRVTVNEKLIGSCTCPFFVRGAGGRRRFCKHVAAAAMMWLGGDWSPAAIDTELVGAIEQIDLFQARELLIEAAGRLKGMKHRIVHGAWSDGPALQQRAPPMGELLSISATTGRRWPKPAPLVPRKARTKRDSAG